MVGKQWLDYFSLSTSIGLYISDKYTNYVKVYEQMCVYRKIDAS